MVEKKTGSWPVPQNDARRRLLKEDDVSTLQSLRLCSYSVPRANSTLSEENSGDGRDGMAAEAMRGQTMA